MALRIVSLRTSCKLSIYSKKLLQPEEKKNRTMQSYIPCPAFTTKTKIRAFLEMTYDGKNKDLAAAEKEIFQSADGKNWKILASQKLSYFQFLNMFWQEEENESWEETSAHFNWLSDEEWAQVYPHWNQNVVVCAPSIFTL